MSNKKKKIFLSAGEVSGDVHGGYLADKLFEYEKDITIHGIGGENMKKAGVKIIDDLTKKNSVGIVEGIPYFFSNLISLFHAKRYLKKKEFDAVVFIDNKGFNLNLAKTTSKENIKSFYYFAPQLWLWGTKKPEKIVKNLDHILATFKREYEFYKSSNIKIDYIGHPLLEELENNYSKKQIIDDLKIDEDGKKIISLFPGSRNQEFKKLFPKYLKIAERLKNQYRFVIPFASRYFFDKYSEAVPGYINIFLNNSHKIMKISDLIILSSGTATLEAAIYEKPMIITYKVSKITEWIARKIVKINHIGMPNILMNEEIVPELIQEDFTVEKVISYINKFFNDRKYYNSTMDNLSKLKKRLKPDKAVSNAAKIILERC